MHGVIGAHQALFMSRLVARLTLKIGTLMVATALCGAALAADVELLPNGLLTPTTRMRSGGLSACAQAAGVVSAAASAAADSRTERRCRAPPG